jgi:hypothetical protein
MRDVCGWGISSRRGWNEEAPLSQPPHDEYLCAEQSSGHTTAQLEIIHHITRLSLKSDAKMPKRNQRHRRGSQCSPYAPRSLRHNEIRILQLLPGAFDTTLVIRLQRATLTPALQYEALSYCWGSQMSPIQARVNGVGIQITENLDCALRHLRYLHTAREIWVDAICINQSDLEERRVQVSIMNRIYAFAQSVVIWLGPAGPEDHIETIITSGRDVHNKDFRWIESLCRIARRPWFSRVWVAQEFALANKDPIVYIGSWFLLWKDFKQKFIAAHLVSFMEDAPTKTEVAIDAAIKRVDLVADTRGTLIGKGQRENFRFLERDVAPAAVGQKSNDGPLRSVTSRAHLGYQLCRTATLEATDARDKVFGLLGMCSFTAGRIDPDYTQPVSIIYTRTAALLLEDGHTEFYMAFPLRALRELSSTSGILEDDLPSWMPDFTLATSELSTMFGDDELNDLTVVRRAYHHPLSLLGSPVADDFPGFLHHLGTRHPVVEPVVKISHDMKIMCTWGMPIDEVSEVIHLPSTESDWSSLQAAGMCALRDLFLDFLEPRKISMEEFLLALSPADMRDPKMIEDEVGFFEMVCRSKHAEEIPDIPRDVFKAMWHFVNLSMIERTLFVTKGNILGVCYSGTYTILPGDAVAGLFGTNMPFLLRPFNTGTHRIINMAYISGHRWGHSFFGNEVWKIHHNQIRSKDAPTDEEIWAAHNEGSSRCEDNATWNDLEVYGMRQYQIV